MAIVDIFPKIVGYWRCNEPSGTRYDCHANWNLAAFNGGTNPPGPYTDGSAAAVVGDGTDWYNKWSLTAGWIDAARGISIGEAYKMPLPWNRSFTQIFWMKAGTNLGLGDSSYNVAYLSSHWDGYASCGCYYNVWLNNGKISFVTRNSVGTNHDLQTASSMNAYRGAFHLYTFSYNVDTGAKRIVIDTTEVASGTGDTTLGLYSQSYGRAYSGSFCMAGYTSNLYTGLQKNPSNYNQFMYAYDWVADDTDIAWFYNGGAGRDYNDIPRNIGSYTKINSGAGAGYATKIQINNTDASIGNAKTLNIG